MAEQLDGQLDRELDRVTDRLRVLGPRWARRDLSADALPLAAVRTALQQLADLAADGRGEIRRQVPDLALHALADQVLVLAGEASAAGQGAPARDVLVGLRHALP
jgi:hypothetical protein